MGTNEGSPLRVVVVEDDRITRDALSILLEGEPGLTVVAAFATGQALLDRLGELAFDVLLCDLGLPDVKGPDLIRAVKAHEARIEIMVHTVSDARDVVFAALRAGATGYILKGSSPRELVEALETLAAGGAPMSPKIARSVVRVFQDEATVDEDYLLSARERDVLQQLERGLSYKEVGAELHISPHTVHSHIKRIYDKLHAQSRREAVRIARLKGLI